MNEINLLPDSRRWFFNSSLWQKIFLSFLFYGLIGGGGVLGGVFIGRKWIQTPVEAANFEDANALSSNTPTPGLIGLSSRTDFLPPSQLQFRLAQEKIEEITRVPIKISYKTKLETIEGTLDTLEIQEILTTSRWGNQVLVVIDSRAFDEKVSSLGRSFGRESKIEINGQVFTGMDRFLEQDRVKQILRDEIFRRREGGVPRSEFEITGLVKETAGSDGLMAEKYLEVDISQQKLYQWETGEVVGVRIISTGKYGPTPIGVHKIMNKAINAWSPPAQVWTPYWMAYAYNPNLGAYLGFHELPYWDGPDGTRIRRPFDTLGEPVTGGCIQLNIGDAEEVFNWAEVGIPVLIHE